MKLRKDTSQVPVVFDAALTVFSILFDAAVDRSPARDNTSCPCVTPAL